MTIGEILGAVEQSAAPQGPFSGVKLMIGIPTRGTCSIYFAHSLAVSVAALTVAKVDVRITHHQANNFVDMSRNKLVATFLASDATHLLMIDDDMGFSTEAILNMLAAKKEFIAGIGNLKTESGEDFAVNLFTNPDGTTVIEDGPQHLMAAQYVGGAFVMLHRGMLERMVRAYPELKSEAVDPAHGYHFFEPQYKPIWRTEDYIFCERWRKLGGEIWCLPDITFTHQGTKEWEGNYFQFRMRKWQEQLAADAAADAITPGPETPMGTPFTAREAMPPGLNAVHGDKRRPNPFLAEIDQAVKKVKKARKK